MKKINSVSKSSREDYPEDYFILIVLVQAEAYMGGDNDSLKVG